MTATFWLLLKKNIHIELKSWKWFTIEMLIVITLTGIIFANPASRKYNEYKDLEKLKPTEYHIGATALYDLSNLMMIKHMHLERLRYKLIYTPNNNFTTTIVERTRNALKLHSIEGLNSETYMNNYISKNEVLAGIEFHNVSNGDIPEKFLVTIRFPSKFRTIKDYGSNIENHLWITRCSGILTLDDADTFRDVDIYAREGFLQLQNRLFIEWVKLLKQKDSINIEKNKTAIKTEKNDKNEQNDRVKKSLEDDTFGKLKKNAKSNSKRQRLRLSNQQSEQQNIFEHILQERYKNKENRRKGNAMNDKDPSDIPHIQHNSFRILSTKFACQHEDSLKFIWFLWHFIFFLTFLNVIWRLSRENEENIIAHHYIYGYEYFQHFFAHFIVFLLHLIILNSIILVVLMVKWSNDPYFFNYHVVTLDIAITFFLLYNIILILYATIISLLFSNAVNATLCGATLWIATYSLFSVLFLEMHDLTPLILFAVSTFCNNYFPIGMHIMKDLDDEADYTMIYRILWTQLANILFLAALIIIINYFKPGRYMARTNFLYSLLCLRKRPRAKHMAKVTTMSIIGINYMKSFEYGPQLSKEVLTLRNVSTNYNNTGRHQRQLRNITMRIYEGEVTVILGGHDNGKAKLISLLAGWCTPESGKIFYKGDDIYGSWQEYRHQIDVCMSYNPLFDMFTVKHTLRYFGLIKQRTTNNGELHDEIQKWQRILDSAKINTDEFVQDLTYSQKHLLTLCCAMMCNTHVILLHEPTLYMEEEYQRFYWEILNEEKKNRVIIVTTISIDEAEEIADRIGILNKGVLVAYGTQYYLKQTFTNGFDLIISMKSSADTKSIYKIITNIIPDAELENQLTNELFYKLPTEKRHLFQHVLLQLESASESLGIINARLFSSELGEVYMITTTDKRTKIIQQNISNTLRFLKESSEAPNRQQVSAILFKKMITQAPNVLPIIILFFVLLLMIFINALITRASRHHEHAEAINIGLDINQTTRNLQKYLEKDCNFIEVTSVANNIINNGYIINETYCSQINLEPNYQIETVHPNESYPYAAVEKSNDTNIRIWSNDAVLHMAPLALNLAHNFILEKLFPDKPSRITGIINKPFPVELYTEINLADNEVSHECLSLIVGTIMPITMACFVTPIIEESHNNLMSLQRLAGIKIHIFWLVGLLWDFCTFFCFSLLYLLTLTVTKVVDFDNNLKLIMLILLNIHAVAVISMMYLVASFMNKSKTRAFLQVALLQYITGLCAHVFYTDVLETHSVFFNVASLSPTFSLLEAIDRMHVLSEQLRYCEKRCEELEQCNEHSFCVLLPSCCSIKYFDIKPPGILSCLLLMLGSTSLFALLFFLYHVYYTEKKYKLPLHLRKKGIRTMRYPFDDDDVVKERTRIAEMTLAECKQYNVLADQLESYIPRHRRRLNTVSFALNKSSCMGIYGAHKSGKSHLINQLVGISGFRYGELYVEGKDFRHNNREALNLIGFCSDVNVLCGEITPRQLFKLLLMINGVSKNDMNNIIKELYLSFDIKRVMNTRITYLSRAMQRRISVAASLIIHNGILILDEPCRGMAGTECAIIMNVLKYARSCGKTIILSSYCNVECQMICDYIVVIQDGEMLAIGSPQYLRQKYTKGVYLIIKLRMDGDTAEKAIQNLEKDVDNILRFADFLHEDAHLIYRKKNILLIYVPIEEISYSYLYGSLEKNFQRLNILSYIVAQGSLMQALERILNIRTLRESFRKSRPHTREREIIV